jgi:cytochrome P450
MDDPYPIYRQLREEAPVFWSDNWNSWVISRVDDVAESLKDKEFLSNENRQALLFDSVTPAEREKLAPLRHYFAQKDVIGSDPPDHTRMRALVQKAFTPKTIATLEPRIRALANEMIGAAAHSGQFDFIDEVLRMIVIFSSAGPVTFLRSKAREEPPMKLRIFPRLLFSNCSTT